jgi:CRISPR-associated protein Cmr4
MGEDDMKTMMLGFLAESAIHCGAGHSAGIIDLPVAREAATDYPFVAGSGLKGALRDRARSLGRADVPDLFGQQDRAGKLLISDARLLLLPVRSLTGSYRWLTSPLLLERYRRDGARCGLSMKLPPVTVAPAGDASGALAPGNGTLYLEERELTITGKCPPEVIDAIRPLVRHDDTKQRIASQLVIVGDDELAWFCRYAVPLQARNVLDDDGSKRSKNLWYEESLPPDTLLYTLVMARDQSAGTAVAELFPDGDPYLQLGGNETVGHGWVVVAPLPTTPGVTRGGSRGGAS